MNNFIYGSSEVSTISGYASSTVRAKTPRLVKLYPPFAIKDESGDWLYDERACVVFITLRHGVKPAKYDSVERFAIESVYHTKILG